MSTPSGPHADGQHRTTTRLVFAEVAARNLKQLPPATLSDPGYADLREQLGLLRDATDKLLRSDIDAVARAQHQVATDHPFMQATSGALLSEQVPAMELAVEEALGYVEEPITTRLEPHRSVPEQLEKERDHLAERSKAVSDLLPGLRELARADGWTGEAADRYAAAARVQIDAVVEYARATGDAAEAFDRAALLHRGTFLAVTELLRRAQQEISLKSHFASHKPFERTRSAVSMLVELASRVQGVINDTEHGQPARSVAAKLSEVLESPEVLLAEGWPTGAPAAVS